MIFIPSSDPPHKDQENLIPAYNRYEMTRLAIQSNPCFEISDIELKERAKATLLILYMLSKMRCLLTSFILLLVLIFYMN